MDKSAHAKFNNKRWPGLFMKYSNCTLGTCTAPWNIFWSRYSPVLPADDIFSLFTFATSILDFRQLSGGSLDLRNHATNLKLVLRACLNMCLNAKEYLCK